MKKNIIHQTIHGYSDGHKLLSSSTTDLDSKFRNRLLRLSDSPGNDFHDDNKPCYTGYADTEAGFYIFSKTIRAEYLKRPGCVWTHSLLIPFSFFYEYEDITFLKKYFLESDNDFESYSALTSIKVDKISESSPKLDERASKMFSQIFSSDNQSVIDIEYYKIDDFLNVWTKLWPEMRLGLSFRTWSPKVISSSSYYDDFDILFSYTQRDFLNEIDWVESLINQSSISCEAFLKNYGRDVEPTKSNVKRLVQCYDLLENKKLEEISVLLLRWKKAPKSLVKTVCCNITKDDLTKPTIYLISSYFLILTHKDISKVVVQEVGAYLFKHDLRLFNAILLSKTEHTRDFSILVLNELSIEIVTDLFNENIYCFEDISNEKILKSSYFWINCENKLDLFHLVISDKFSRSFIDLNVFEPDEVISMDSMENGNVYRLCIETFSELNCTWKKHIESHKKDFLLNIKCKDLESEPLSTFILYEFNIKHLSTLSDNKMATLYSNTKINDLALYKIILFLIRNIDNNFSKLLCVAFDEICYFVSNDPLRYSERASLIEDFNYIVKPKYYIFDKLRRTFFDFILFYTNKYNIPLDSITKYDENLYALKKAEKNMDDSFN